MTHHDQFSLRNFTVLAIALAVSALCLCAVLLLPGSARAWLLPPPIIATDEPLTSQADPLAPFRVIAHQPARNEVGVALSAPISATTDGDLDMGTVRNDTFVVHGHLGGLASGTFYHGPGAGTLRLDPDRAFHAGEVLRVSATGGIWSAGGAALMPYGWQFTAGEVYSRCVAGFSDIGAGLTGVDYSSAAWGDVDNDGDLDILLTGRPDAPPYSLSTIYRNDGGGVFTDIGAGLPGVKYGSAAWGDCDNDGDLDILLTGQGDSDVPVARVYRNDGGGVFVDLDAGLVGVQFSSVAWGDYDNDGDLDILLAGEESGGNYVTVVYRNDGASGFTEIDARLEGVVSGSVAWGDYDNDGDLDILLTGYSAFGRLSRVYRNRGDDTFSDIYANLTAVEMSSAAWGDIDNDGWLDILLTGTDDAVTARAIVYRNEGGAFGDIGASLTGVSAGSAAWGDYDNDGDLDILLSGQDDTLARRADVYRNDGGGAFTDINAGLTGVLLGSVAWGDYDNDGDLDILLTGEDESRTAVSVVYRSEDCLDIVAHSPAANVVGVPPTAAITAAFNADVEVGTVTSHTFAVHGNMGSSISGTFAYDAASRTLMLDPNRDLYAGEVLRVSASSAISSTRGVSLTPYGWQFTAGEVYSRCFRRFTDIGADLVGGDLGSVAWGDYDNDGDLDILLAGCGGLYGGAALYRNDGDGTFTDIGAGLGSGCTGSVAWGDYDNDSDLDILLAARSVSTVYRNDGNGTFTDIEAGLPWVEFSSAAWGDYDNDGDLDILLTGNHRYGMVARVYRNNGDDTFSDIDAGLPGVWYGSGTWGDYDNDGDLDILLTRGSSSPMFRNNGDETFTHVDAGMIGVELSAAAWGDYDNDGDLDILIAGVSAYGRLSSVYRNDGAGVFTDIGAGLVGVSEGSVAWGDYDNDGDLDILLTGYTSANDRVSRVYRNNGDDTFTPAAGLTPVAMSDAAWGDYDNDGDLDVVLAGFLNGYVAKVFRNDDCLDIVGHAPQAHAVGVPLTAAVTATFNGDVDASTVTSRTFALHGSLGSSISGTFGYDPASRTLTLDPDRAFHAGEALRVSATQSILDTRAARLTPYGWQFTAGDVYPRSVAGFVDIGAALAGVFNGSAAWGDYDGDGDLDILLTGWTGSDRVSMLYRNDGALGFSDVSASAGLTGVSSSSAAWGDYDNDRDLDILLTGWDGSEAVSLVYRNDAHGSAPALHSRTASPAFTDIGAGLPGVSVGSVAWGDVDNDGDLDILLSGASLDPSHVSEVYRNDGASGFTGISAGIAALSNSSVAWGDYDNDADLDILLSGLDAIGDPLCWVYRNDGEGKFVVAAMLTPVAFGSAAWGDVDNDGDLDVLLTGDTGSGVVSEVHRNNGDGTFTDIGAALSGVSNSSVAWGDVDNDGDLDILLTGWPGPVSKVYRNDGSGAFTDMGALLTGVRRGSVAWGDVDNDGDLDILLTGYDSSGSAVSKVYRNNSLPILDDVTPSSGSGPSGVTTYFTTTWSDPDGWQDLKQCYFHIGDSPSTVGSVTLLYNAAKDKLWLLDDAGANWLGGFAPGSANTIHNSQAIVDCSLTAVHGSGDTLSLSWAIEFRTDYTGVKKTGLKCADRYKARAKGEWKGTWEIQ